MVALGESQSALLLTTYVNAVDPLTRVYDGFLVHCRFGPPRPWTAARYSTRWAAVCPNPCGSAPTCVPLVTVITETDLLGGPRQGCRSARQAENSQRRVWEVAGTAHADNDTIQVAPIDTGSAALPDIVAACAPIDVLMGRQLNHCINFAPQHHYVLQAALVRLCDWVRTGRPPPSAVPIETTDAEPPRLLLDANGLGRGGVRTPWVVVPVARTSGIATFPQADEPD